MNSRRTLPLHVLPAFESAARHGGFRAAAHELHLTPSAISHQIKLLEDALGVTLFRRTPRGLVLTAAGERYRTTVHEVLQRLDHDAGSLRGAVANRTLRISMPDYFAEHYFVRKLHELRAEPPGLRLEINVGLDLADVEGGAVDAAIRMGAGTWGRLRSWKLSDVWGTLVAAPELAERARALSDHGELPFVHLPGFEPLMHELLSAAGLRGATARGLAVNDYGCLVEAAQEGLGVALLLHAPHSRPSPSQRQVPLGEPVAMPFSMYLVCREADADQPHLQALRSWLFKYRVDGAGGGTAALDSERIEPRS